MNKDRLFIFSLITLCFTISGENSHLIAGTTGKITGRVIDRQTNEPLPGVNIVLEGTGWGAASDLEGNYLIMNVPPGGYTLNVTMLGYKEVHVENVRVKIDLTTTINVSMEATVLEAGETVTVVAERPLVQLDMTSSMTSVGSNEIASLPVESVEDVLELQAGVVRTGNDLHIRGGRAGEVAYWIDGVSTTDVFSGDRGVTVENAAIEELQVVSGTFNAEYGQAMSGIVNIITKEGGRHYTGQIKAYVGDYVSTDEHFQLAESIETKVDPVTGAVTPISTMENPIKKFNPIYNGEFSLNGPVPFSGDQLSFFTNARYYSTEGHLYGRNWFTPQGTAGDSSLVPMNPYKRLTALGKLTYRMSSSLKLSYNLFYNDWKNDRTYSKDWKYCPYSRPQQFGGGTTHIATLNHVLSPSTFYEVHLNRFYNEYTRYLYEDPLAMPKYLVQVYDDTTLNILEHVFDPSTESGQAELESITQNRVDFDYVIDPKGPAGYISPDSANAPTAYSFNTIGTDREHYNRSTSYWIGKFDLTSQINRVHQIKAGLEYRQHKLKLNRFEVRPKTNESGTEQIVPFAPTIPDISTTYVSRYTREPKEVSFYVQDKIELKDLIMNVGLRFDYFDANSVVPGDPSDPNIYFPFRPEHKYKNWANPPDTLTLAEYDAYISGLEQYTAEERRAFMHKETKPHSQLSPRLGIAYPITDKGVIHFSYGNFFQVPEFEYLYANPDFKVSASSGYFIFGNAALKPQRTVQYEIGLQQQLTENMGVDVTLFYRDVRDWVGTSPLIETAIPSVLYSQYENKDYSNVRGITFKLEKRTSLNFSARLDYTFEVAEGTYSNPDDAFNSYQANEEPRLALLPLNWDRRHSANGSLVYRKSDWTVSLIGRYWDGLPYTPSFAKGEVVGGSVLIGLKENSERRPGQKSVDLYINRMIRMSGMYVQLFCNIYNLFDNRDDTSVYSDTGTAEYTTNIDPKAIPYNPQRVGTIKDYVLQPSWYTAPREIQVGMSLGF
ncbi:hypothetical protein A2V82_10205 [candidate division KSB1 bacterium RBG_16_48_16]|nr:MAG: hypothetical protein A2V82_10205 [candidate division KSB1 bacterium RBG_16_48_16]